jgi:hypothetical protein
MRLITIMLCLLPLATPLLSNGDEIHNNPSAAQTNSKTQNEQDVIESPSPVQPPPSEPTPKPNNQGLKGDIDAGGEASAARANAIARSANEIAIDDLAEQHRMAEGTELMVKISYWQFWAGALGLILLGWTLRETRRTADAAVRQAEANRAWVTAPTDFSPVEYDGGSPQRLRFRMGIQNSGITPANNIQITVALMGPNEMPEWETEVQQKYNYGLLGPGDKVVFPINELKVSMIENAIFSGTSLTMKVIINYATIMQGVHGVTQITYEIQHENYAPTIGGFRCGNSSLFYRQVGAECLAI